MTKEELIELFNSCNICDLNRGMLMDDILELHEEKVKQLAIYLNK